MGLVAAVVPAVVLVVLLLLLLLPSASKQAARAVTECRPVEPKCVAGGPAKMHRVCWQKGAVTRAV